MLYLGADAGLEPLDYYKISCALVELSWVNATEATPGPRDLPLTYPPADLFGGRQTERAFCGDATKHDGKRPREGNVREVVLHTVRVVEQAHRAVAAPLHARSSPQYVPH